MVNRRLCYNCIPCTKVALRILWFCLRYAMSVDIACPRDNSKSLYQIAFIFDEGIYPMEMGMIRLFLTILLGKTMSIFRCQPCLHRSKLDKIRWPNNLSKTLKTIFFSKNKFKHFENSRFWQIFSWGCRAELILFMLTQECLNGSLWNCYHWCVIYLSWIGIGEFWATGGYICGCGQPSNLVYDFIKICKIIYK